ncbi:diacylglycerol/lipid kinase family protein [Caulobacter mirabilis]|uniref:diacylglycerol/lipid kinase family protein n=1 Tax=Caulobacter mirabilis TaxID=69666 RepID=UPI001FE42AA9|nr:diacylglycerol kinase family protein [Caulobacter mirabilis]
MPSDVVTPKLRRVAVVVNPLSGSAGPAAVDEARRILEEQCVQGVVRTPEETGGVEACLRASLEDNPDLLAVVAGDGTARAAAGLAGADGPLVAPLPGGTMNMLPRALYGDRDWKQALADILRNGEERIVSGGEVEGRAFYVAAILGAPALWAQAREAAREGDLWRTLQRARRALRRAFSGRLRVSLDGRPRVKTEALVLMCPLVSAALDEEARHLEAALLDPANALEAFRLGVHAATGDWRADPKVQAGPCHVGRAWASSHIPAVLDGEPARLNPTADFRFVPKAFRALVPKEPAA